MNKVTRKKQKLGIAIIVFATITGFYSFWPTVAPLPPLAGTYLTAGEDSLSWITITEKGKDDISCVWNKMQATNKGIIKENRLALEGKQDGSELNLAMQIPGAVPQEVTAYGKRKDSTIRMNLSLEGNVFFAGVYDPVDTVKMTVAMAEFKKKAAQLAEKWQDSQTSGGKTDSEQVKSGHKMIELGTEYINKMDGFVKRGPEMAKTYRDNTASIREHLENTKRIPGAANASVRSQFVMMMVSIAESSQNVQDQQSQFAQYYTKEIMPFFDGLTVQQKICVDAKAKGMSDEKEEQLCAIAAQLQESMAASSRNTQLMMKEVSGIYTKEYPAQVQMIADARAIQ